MLKRIFKIAIWTIVIIFLIIICYIWFYDGLKPSSIKPLINETHLAQEFQRLKQTEGEQRESTYQNGKNKAIIVISFSRTNSDNSLRDQNILYIDSGLLPYYELDTNPSTAVVFYDWQFKSLKRKYFEGNDYNMYEKLYGKEAAAGKPSYQYYINFIIEKGESRYSVNAFCNSDNFLDEIITEFVNQVNNLE